MGEVRIRDIYVGSLDAKEEITLNDKKFMDTFVLPPQLDIDGLARENLMFLVGDKGVGKTSAMRYLSQCFSQEKPETKSSFLLFQSGEKIAGRVFVLKKGNQLFVNYGIGPRQALEVEDFSFLWRWNIYLSIIRDNQDGSIFVRDEKWQAFESVVLNALKTEHSEADTKKDPISFLESLSFFLLENPHSDGHLTDMENARHCFEALERGSAPYYIFIDELDILQGVHCKDVSLGGEETPKKGGSQEGFRDLRLVRDLVLEVRRINAHLELLGWQEDMKVFCAVRKDILSIACQTFADTGRRLEDYEIGLSVFDFLGEIELNQCELSWGSDSKETYASPIMRVLLKRIEAAEKSHALKESVKGKTASGDERIGLGESAGILGSLEASQQERSLKDCYERWFPESVQGMEPAVFIKRITWSRPVDVIRLLKAARAVRGNDTFFSEGVFQDLLRRYGEDSLKEIKKELKAGFTSDYMDEILDCFINLPEKFTLEEFKERLEESDLELSDLNSAETDLRAGDREGLLKKMDAYEVGILKELYRVGVIGQVGGSRIRWAYCGDAFKKRLVNVVHPGLAFVLDVVIDKTDHQGNGQGNLETKQMDKSPEKPQTLENDKKKSQTNPKEPTEKTGDIKYQEKTSEQSGEAIEPKESEQPGVLEIPEVNRGIEADENASASLESSRQGETGALETVTEPKESPKSMESQEVEEIGEPGKPRESEKSEKRAKTEEAPEQKHAEDEQVACNALEKGKETQGPEETDKTADKTEPEESHKIFQGLELEESQEEKNAQAKEDTEGALEVKEVVGEASEVVAEEAPEEASEEASGEASEVVADDAAEETAKEAAKAKEDIGNASIESNSEEKEVLEEKKEALEEETQEEEKELEKIFITSEEMLKKGDALREAKQFKDAFLWYQMAAQKDVVEAQFNLGEFYYYGLGVTKDLKKAAYWCEKAASKGMSQAQFVLGLLYQLGEGVPRNNEQAKKWTKMAADQGYAAAQLRLAQMYIEGSGVSKKLKEASAELFKSAANQGLAEAQFNTGMCYLNGDGFSRNVQKAIKYFRMAAEQNHPKSMYIMASFYDSGKGVTRDLNKAVQYIKRAAELGLVEAYYQYASYLREGAGIERDEQEALKWLRKGALEGQVDCQSLLGALYYTGESVKEDFNEAKKWLEMAVSQNDSYGQYYLGMMYLRGDGVVQDKARGIELIKKSARQGMYESRMFLTRMRIPF